MKVNSSKSGLGGVLVVVLVLSTLIVLSIGRGAIGSPIYLARNDYPTVFASSEATGEPMVFGFGIISKESLREIEIRYSSLFVTPPPEFEDPAFNPNESTPTEIMEARRDIRAIKLFLGNVTIPYDVIPITGVVGNKTSRVGFTGVVYDFTRTLQLFLDEAVLDNIFEVYAVLKFENGKILYMAGVPDFFYARSRNVRYLSIHYNQNETTYQRRSPLLAEATPVDQAPGYGSLTFRDVKPDDQIFIQMNVEANLYGLPIWVMQSKYRTYLAEYVRVYANGKLEINAFNLMPMQSGGWAA